MALISVAVGVGLAVAYFAAFLWFQLFIGRRSPTLMPALTVAGFVVRLTLFAVFLVLLALFTDLNIIITGAVSAVLYTVLSAWGIYHYVAKSKRNGAATGGQESADATKGRTTGRREPGTRPVNGPKGA